MEPADRSEKPRIDKNRLTRGEATLALIDAMGNHERVGGGGSVRAGERSRHSTHRRLAMSEPPVAEGETEGVEWPVTSELA
jgi:hypothetical protein